MKMYDCVPARRRTCLESALKAFRQRSGEGIAAVLSDDVELTSLLAEPALRERGIVRGREAVRRYFENRFAECSEVDITDVMEGELGTMLLLRHGRNSVALAVAYDDQDCVRRIDVWHSVGADFGIP